MEIGGEKEEEDGDRKNSDESSNSVDKLGSTMYQIFCCNPHRKEKKGSEWWKTYNFEFDCVAIGSGGKFATNRLNKWDPDRRKDQHWDPSQLYYSAVQATEKALIDSTVDDLECGGQFRVIWLGRETYSEATHSPISTMCRLTPGFSNMALLFFSRESYRLMNYANLEKLLMEEFWLPKREGIYLEKAPPSCLGVVAGAHLFLVNFARINDSRKYAEEYFERCTPMVRDGIIRGVQYGHRKLLFCWLDYNLLWSISEEHYRLPWQTLLDWT